MLGPQVDRAEADTGAWLRSWEGLEYLEWGAQMLQMAGKRIVDVYRLMAKPISQKDLGIRLAGFWQMKRMESTKWRNSADSWAFFLFHPILGYFGVQWRQVWPIHAAGEGRDGSLERQLWRLVLVSKSWANDVSACKWCFRMFRTIWSKLMFLMIYNIHVYTLILTTHIRHMNILYHTRDIHTWTYYINLYHIIWYNMTCIVL